MKITNLKMVQTIAEKKAEVNFRDSMSRQHLDEQTVHPEELNQQEMLGELKKRLASTDQDLQMLQAEKIKLTPFLEIGAEYCARAMLVRQKFLADGIAVDIAAKPLQSAGQFAKNLNFHKLPMRICADAYALPFTDNSFAFVFCYQTLHHFPDPLPIIREICRILAPGGYFFFGEEPIKQNINLRLFRRPTKFHSWYKFLKYILILPFISEIGKTEVEAGILENSFTLSQWEKALTPFQNIKVWLSPVFVGIWQKFTKDANARFIKPAFLQSALISLLGGGIKGLARKEGKLPQKIVWHLRCPDCQQKLTRQKSAFVCQSNHSYKKANGVLILLTRKLKRILYPDF